MSIPAQNEFAALLSKPAAQTEVPAPVVKVVRRSRYLACGIYWLMAVISFFVGAMIHAWVALGLFWLFLGLSFYALFFGIPLPEEPDAT